MQGFDGFPEAPGTARGYRSWHLSPGYYLEGRFGGVWMPGENTARCMGHQVPADDCGCGFWAYWEATPKAPFIAGVIEGYGRTLIGDRGFRCEKARILALCSMREKVRAELAAKYGVPVFRTGWGMRRHFPADPARPPARLLPWKRMVPIVRFWAIILAVYALVEGVALRHWMAVAHDARTVSVGIAVMAAIFWVRRWRSIGVRMRRWWHRRWHR